MEEKEKFRVFGAALDALDLPEKVALKQAYVRALAGTQCGSPQGSHCVPGKGILDPYDAVKAALERDPVLSPCLEWGGKMEVETWLTPRPALDDEGSLQRGRFTEFLDGNGCLSYRRRVRSHLEDRVFPLRPLMIGVDHSLTGGVIDYLAARYEELNVIVLDSHTDMVDFSTKMSHLTSPLGKGADRALNIYECGSFLEYLLEEGVISPDRVWVLGTQDMPGRTGRGETDAYGRKLKDWTGRGVHLISKEALVRDGIPGGIEGPTYISIDMDLGSYASVFACRFMDRAGLDNEQIMGIVTSLGTMIRKGRISLVGMDIMEIDVHFLEREFSGRQDCTLKIIKKIFQELLH